jgi:hypothetical protein
MTLSISTIKPNLKALISSLNLEDIRHKPNSKSGRQSLGTLINWKRSKTKTLTSLTFLSARETGILFRKKVLSKRLGQRYKETICLSQKSQITAKALKSE